MKLVSPILALLLVASVTRSWGAAEFKEAEITTIKNMVEHDAGTGAAPAKVNEMIQEKSKVSTAAASMAELTFADSSITRMGSNTQFSFQSKERLVKLDQGTLLIHTPPGNGGATVDCGGVTGAVSGTTFMASRDVSGNVMFILLEGQGGLKVTAGGSTTVIRPGQAASVGAEQKAEAGSGKSDAPGGGAQPEAKAGGAQSDDAAGGGSGAAESPAPAPARPVEIKVFEVDVKRIVSTSPLVVDFKAELPSAGKIEQTIEVQQAKVQEGKLEKLDVEVVAVKSADGDLLVGAPKVEKEEMVVVNKKVDIMGNSQGGGGDKLDIETAAGPGAGGGVAAAPAPRPETPAPSPVAVNPPPVNPGQTAIVPPASPSKVAVTARVNDVSRPFNQDNPNFGFSITSGSLLAGHSLVSDFLTAATRTSGVVGSPYAVNFSNPRILDASGNDVTSRYTLTTQGGSLTVVKAPQTLAFGGTPSAITGSNYDPKVIPGTAGPVTVQVLETDGRATLDPDTGRIILGKVLGADSFQLTATTAGSENLLPGSVSRTIAIIPDEVAIQAANPARRMLQTPAADELAALDKYFYYTAKAAGLTADAPSGFFATEKSKSLSLAGIETAKLDKLYAGQTSDYFLTGTLTSPATALPEINLNNRDRVIYADKIEINPLVAAGKTITDNVSATIPDGNPAGLARVLDLSKEGLSGGLPWFVESTQLQIAGNDAAYGAFAGDFQAYLRYRSGFGEASTVMLLDRIGTTAVNPDGSDANGLDVTFRDFADMAIHQAAPAVAGGVITGAYLPDHGNTLLTAGLGPVDSSGQITLGIFDLSAGAAGDLQSWSVGLVQRLGISLENGVGRDFTLAAGDGGLLLKNTFWDLGATRADFITAGDLFLQANSFFFPGNNLRMEAAGKAELADVQVMGNATKGSGVAIRAKGDVTLTDTAVKEVGGDLEVASLAGSVELQASKIIGTQEVAGSVNLQAEGKVKMSGTTVVDLDTSAGAKPSVSPVSTAPGSGSQNLAVIRSGDSLELRNVVIRGFHGTRLENGAGRVLMSGSAVTQFKIKELTGMAVNADAKIQMAAYDSAGKLEGEMVVENQLPVATKLASQIDNTITGTLGNTSVHAKDVELAARTVRFNDATIAAMNSITARANTILVQNSFMTVVQNTGMINMYVSSGLVNQNFGSVVDGRLNFAGLNTFTIGNNSFAIGNQAQLNAAYGTNLIEIPSGGSPQAGKVNVLKL